MLWFRLKLHASSTEEILTWQLQQARPHEGHQGTSDFRKAACLC